MTVPRINGWPQPLCAVYHRDLLGSISASLRRRRLQSDVRGYGGGRAANPILWGPNRYVFDVELVASANSELLAFSPLPSTAGSITATRLRIWQRRKCFSLDPMSIPPDLPEPTMGIPAGTPIEDRRPCSGFGR